MALMNPVKEAEIEREWQRLLYKIKPTFNQKLNLQAVLFLIGVQELGRVRQDFSKEEKQDLMHIAVCKLLSQEGIYSFKGKDPDGWPIWEKTDQSAPLLDLGKQEMWLKELVIKYFEDY